MKISKIIKISSLKREFDIINEQEFDILMLSESKFNKKACIFIDDEKYAESITENVSMVITREDLKERFVHENRGVCVTDSPRLFFFELHNALCETAGYTRGEFVSEIDETAQVSEKSEISKYNVSIGKNVIIEPFVVVYPNVKIGDNVILRSGSMIGGVGFEFKRVNGSIMSVQHVGGVSIGNNVEIQNNTCVDRAIYPWDDTVIGDNVKIDNLVHVAHGVKINKNVMIVANSGIGGRVHIQENAWIGFGATIRNGISIGANARANMGSVVTRNVDEEQAVTGNFAIDHKQFIDDLKNKNSRGV